MKATIFTPIHKEPRVRDLEIPYFVHVPNIKNNLLIIMGLFQKQPKTGGYMNNQKYIKHEKFCQFRREIRESKEHLIVVIDIANKSHHA